MFAHNLDEFNIKLRYNNAKKVNILISGGSGFLDQIVTFLFLNKKYDLYLLKDLVQIFLELIKTF